MTDTIIASLSLAAFLAFLAFLAVYIGEFDLWIVVLAVAMLSVTDVIQTLRSQSGDTGGSESV